MSYEGAPATKEFALALNSEALDATVDGKVDLAASNIKITTEAKYKTPTRETNPFKSTLLLGIQREGEETTYFSRLDMNIPSSVDPIVIEYSVKVSPTKLNSEVHYKSGDIEINAKEEWMHTYEDGVRRITGHVSSKCEQMDIDHKADTEIVLAPNSIYIKSEASGKAMGEVETRSILLDLQRTPGTSLIGNLKIDWLSRFMATAKFMKLQPGHYSGEVSSIQLLLWSLSQ